MKFGIRKKMFLIIFMISILISFIIGFSIFMRSYTLFLKNYLRDKYSLARSIADSIDGDVILTLNKPQAINDNQYIFYQRYLNKIKSENPDISYLYSVIYDDKRKHHVYTIDSNINKSNTFWIESDLFSFICRIAGNKLEIEYDQNKYTEDFKINHLNKIINVKLKNNSVYINDTLLFMVKNYNPLELDTIAGNISEIDKFENLSKNGNMTINNESIPIYFTLCVKGYPESIPGESYNEHDMKSISQLNGLLSENKDYESEKFTKTEFGDTLFIYCIIHKKSGLPAGVLVLEIWATNVSAYKQSIITIACIVSLIALILSTVIYLLIIENFIIKAIKKFSKGVKEITNGNFNFHVNMTRNDEIGELAKTFNNMADGLKERDLVKGLFGKYVQKEVVDVILKSELKLGGEKQEATVLFSDIRKFSTISEQMDPKILISMLNRYFTVMVEDIIKYNGVLDKYIGDALMVHFGILGDTKNSADNAVKAAIDMTRSIVDFNERQKNYKEPKINIGIGIHTGELIAGNIGSPNRMEYTVVGDTVNVASRSEGLTKIFGSNIVITESTLEKLKNRSDYLVRPLDIVVVKGKIKPIQMYEIFDMDSEKNKKLKLNTLDQLNSAITLYRNREFRKAKKLFKELYKINNNDTLFKYYLDLIDYVIKNPPLDNWDGSNLLKTK